MSKDQFAAVFAQVEDAPHEKSGDGWAGAIGGFCPVQGEGTIGEYSWYFRARWKSWRFEVYPPGATPVWSVRGDYPNAGWMPLSKAWALIEAGLAQWQQKQEINNR